MRRRSHVPHGTWRSCRHPYVLPPLVILSLPSGQRTLSIFLMLPLPPADKRSGIVWAAPDQRLCRRTRSPVMRLLHRAAVLAAGSHCRCFPDGGLFCDGPAVNSNRELMLTTPPTLLVTLTVQSANRRGSPCLSWLVAPGGPGTRKLPDRRRAPRTARRGTSVWPPAWSTGGRGPSKGLIRSKKQRLKQAAPELISLPALRLRRRLLAWKALDPTARRRGRGTL